MKNLLWLLFCIPFAAKAQFTIVNTATINLVELRQGGTWPINLQRVTKESDTCYVLSFRDQEYTNDVIMTTLRFKDMEQLKYFEKGLSALKMGSSGDIAKFKEYTVKRLDVRKEGITYVLSLTEGATTNFQQSEADKIIAAIKIL
jgi:hypothetical protein